ncbi:MAG TPA: molecular chaperone HtpG, partial [Arenimonas sp.]|nr:molecular chaperone HtpG [Arenimonas sp.]
YSNKDVFLRELVSNAADACDKLRFEALQDAGLYGDQPELRIDISWDKDARTLTLTDTGIGMSRDELIGNLGTIARSGTKKFLEALSESQKADAQLIGQFGVGFYSAFVVADKVTVESRRAGGTEAWRWTSSGEGEFELDASARSERGTAITLHLKDGEDEYFDGWKLRELVRRYSDHIGFPIRMQTEKDGKPEGEFEAINQASALWTRPKTELSDDDYQAFYKHISHDFNEALAWTHNRVEGNQNFTSLIYLPSKAPFDFQFNRDERRGLKLYVKRVFIMDAAEQMLPAYLRFVRGVLDSDDLPLNVSRELLQGNRQLDKLKAALTKRSLDLLEKIAREDNDKYLGFWHEFGGVIKEGLAEDHGNRERIAKLLRVASTQSEKADDLTSLDSYVERMKAGQTAIYYLTADGWNAARHSPQLEALRARGIEVLLLHERIDEWAIGYLTEYAGKPLKHIGKGELDLDALDSKEDKDKREEAAKAAQPLVDAVKALLGDKVKDVRVSMRLTDSPACLVQGEYDMSLHLQRLLKAAGQAAPASTPTLEINPQHALLRRFEGESDAGRREDLALLLLEQAQVAEGAPLEDPAAFVQRVNRLLAG